MAARNAIRRMDFFIKVRFKIIVANIALLSRWLPAWLFPKRGQFVPRMATLFVHHVTEVKEEVVTKNFGSAGDSFAVEVPLLEHFVDVRAIAMHPCGEPADRPALLVENRLDDMSCMEIRHPPCIKLYRELLSEVEVLAYLLSQQESPRYVHAGDPLSW